MRSFIIDLACAALCAVFIGAPMAMYFAFIMKP